MTNFHLNKVASSVTIALESANRDTNLENFGSLANAIAPMTFKNTTPMDEQQRQAKKRPLRNFAEELYSKRARIARQEVHKCKEFQHDVTHAGKF